MINLQWIKCYEGKVWCPLKTVDLSKVTATGVYVIWHGGDPPNIVRVGQGKITDRLEDHRADQEIIVFKQFGELSVTWASVPAAQRDGVEHYLGDQYHPLIGDVFPAADPIEVNLPV